LEANDRQAFSDSLERTCGFADGVARSGDEMTARQAASALYHITSAIGLAHESIGAHLPHRLALAKLVLQHRLQVRDPLAPPADEALIETALAGAFRSE
jgi:acyl-CoA dehydrogenase